MNDGASMFLSRLREVRLSAEAPSIHPSAKSSIPDPAVLPATVVVPDARTPTACTWLSA